jgi:hypothetical protein
MSNQPLERDQDTIQAMSDPELLKWRELASIQTEIHPQWRIPAPDPAQEEPVFDQLTPAQLTVTRDCARVLFGHRRELGIEELAPKLDTLSADISNELERRAQAAAGEPASEDQPRRPIRIDQAATGAKPVITDGAIVEADEDQATADRIPAMRDGDEGPFRGYSS